MTAKRPLTAHALKKIDNHRIAPEEYEDAPELTPEQLANAVLSRGGVPVKRGRPKSANAKKPVTLLLPPETLTYFRESGPGWQTRISDMLTRHARRERTKAPNRRRKLA